MKDNSRFLRTVVAKFDKSKEATLRTIPGGRLVTLGVAALAPQYEET